MKGRAACALFVLVSFAFLEADANMQSMRLESRTLDRKRRSLLNDAEKAEVVKAHNDVRRMEGSSNMELMSWNDILANMAKAWAENCTSGHDESFLKPPSSLGYDSAGQNWYLTLASSINMTSITLEWYKEKRYYSYDTGSCSPGTKCGHYTQVVWASSRLIGCAYSHCDTVVNSSYTNAIVVVCDYAARGNYQDQKPYLMGPPCTECASENDKCNGGLCDESTCSPPTCQNNGTLNSDGCSCYCQPNYCGSDCSSVVCAAVDVRSLTMTAKMTVALSLTILLLFSV